VGYAPAADPKIVVAVVIEHGGQGANAAAPAVCQTMGAYLHFDPQLCGAAQRTN
jgi:cell division protein FtsI/penicillin-binding protein 2